MQQKISSGLKMISLCLIDFTMYKFLIDLTPMSIPSKFSIPPFSHSNLNIELVKIL